MSQSKKVQIRDGFSDRMGIQPLNRTMQVKDFDPRTRTALANLMHDWLFMTIFNNKRRYILQDIATNVFNELLSIRLTNAIEADEDQFVNDYIAVPITNNTYDEVLSLVEYITQLLTKMQEYTAHEDYAYYYSIEELNFSFEQSLNQLFKKEFVGYRMIEGQITPITNETEIEPIKRALHNKYEGCREHISKALSFLSDREKPDYKNSVKESISAVESICQIITGDNKATLGKALKQLQNKGIKLHPSLIGAFSKFYGYASDQGGICHAEGMFKSNVSFEDAEYMLVSCSAFINYLMAKNEKNEE